MAPFDYYTSNLPGNLAKTQQNRSTEAFVQEIEEKTTLLHKLGFTKDQVIARLKANISWEFDKTWTDKNPSFLKSIDKVVTAYFKKMADKRD